MARINVYVPDELAKAARSAELNVSALTQTAIRQALDARSVTNWLDSVASLETASADHDDVIAALDHVRNELWGDD